MGFLWRLFVVVLAVVGVSVFIQWQEQIFYQKSETEALPVTQDTKTAQGTETTRVRIGSYFLNAEIADTDTKRAQGLSGRMALAENAGMLFVFDVPGFYNFWMPNMHFPIDIIWINESRRVIGFEKNVPPIEIGKDTTLYSPPSPIKYALEVNADFVERYNIAVGQQIDFE